VSVCVSVDSWEINGGGLIFIFLANNHIARDGTRFFRVRSHTRVPGFAASRLCPVNLNGENGL